jgi:hypothetical protein
MTNMQNCDWCDILTVPEHRTNGDDGTRPKAFCCFHCYQNYYLELSRLLNLKPTKEPVG